jgi:hypothetical protein
MVLQQPGLTLLRGQMSSRILGAEMPECFVLPPWVGSTRYHGQNQVYDITYVTLKNLYFNQFAEITETKTINIL